MTFRERASENIKIGMWEYRHVKSQWIRAILTLLLPVAYLTWVIRAIFDRDL